MTDKPFGVNLTFLPAVTPPDYPGYVRAILGRSQSNRPPQSFRRSRHQQRFSSKHPIRHHFKRRHPEILRSSGLGNLAPKLLHCLA